MVRYVVVAWKVVYGGDHYSVMGYTDDVAEARAAQEAAKEALPGYEVSVYQILPDPPGE